MRARLIAIAFLFGCGGSDDVNVGTDQNNVCGEVAEVACHNMYQCCTEGEIERSLGVSDPRTEGECRDDIRNHCERTIALLDFGIKEKRLRFDSKIMNGCLNALLAPGNTCATVEDALPWIKACLDNPWVGLIDDGGACTSTQDCASKDSFCAANKMCTALPTEGQPCNTAGSVTGCATDLFCSVGPTASTCTRKLAAGAMCTSSFACLEDLFCDLDATPSVCTPLRAPDEACNGNASCTSSICNRGRCADGNQTCSSDAECFTGHCANDNRLCSTDSGCTGRCSVTLADCSNIMPCLGGVGDVCVFPRCIHECVGAVCAHAVADYCQAALNNLPVR
jgi:hypothetical protein